MPVRLASHSVPLALSILLAMAPLGAQDVQKPTATATGMDRLPAPARVTVRQTGPTEITLTWGAVEGATSYVLGRSVGAEGFRRVYDASTGPDTIYVDHKVTPGVRHTYTVTAVSQTTGARLRAISEPIVPTATAIGSPTTANVPMTVTATRTAPDAIAVTWNRPGPNTAYYTITHWLDDKIALYVPRTDSPGFAQGQLAPGAHRFQVNAVTSTGALDATGSSNVIVIDATPTPTVAPAPANPTAAVLVAVGAPVTIRVGGTTSLPAAGQWTSLNPALATVTADGTVTGRAAGTAQVAALGTGSDGAVHVTVVRVVVQP